MPVAAKSSRCVECGAPLPAHRLKWRATTCSARCGQARQRRRRPKPTKRKITSSPQNPPILGLTVVEAAERIGIPHKTAHTHCVEHGLGRRYNDGRWWLTLAELRTLTERGWRGRAE